MWEVLKCIANAKFVHLTISVKDLYLQCVPVYEDIEWVGRRKLHARGGGIPKRKVASSVKYKMAQAILVWLLKKLYIHIY